MDHINYSEADAEFDSQLVFQEIQDLDSITWMGNAVSSGIYSEQASQVRSAVQSHLKSARFLKFSQEAIRAELSNIKKNALLDASPFHESSVFENVEAYKEKLSENRCICAVDIPKVEQMISDAGQMRMEASMKQLKKDIERDRLLINGIRIVGAESGLDSVMQKMCDICDDIHQECGVPKLGAEAKEYTVLSLLSKASRSHSGGIALHAAMSLINIETAMLVPQSAVTPPLKISLHLGAFPEHCRVRTQQAGVNPMSAETDSRSAGSANTERKEQLEEEQVKEACSTEEDNLRVSHAPVKWGLVGKVVCESIFKVQLYEKPDEEVGYDDCSTAEIEDGSDETPCLFRVVPSSSSSSTKKTCAAANCGSRSLDNKEFAAEELSPLPHPTSNTETTDNVRPPPSSPPSSSPSSPRVAGPGGVCIGHRNTFVSVIYEDYVLFEVKLAPPGELSNLANLTDNWKSTATVTITEIVPVRTLM